MIDLIIGAERHFQQYSAISWRPVSVMEEAGVPGENHRRRASNWSTLSHAAVYRVHPFCNLQSRARTHAVLVIGLYELLGNPSGHELCRRLAIFNGKFIEPSHQAKIQI